MRLAFDIGNSAIKGGAFSENRLRHAFSLPRDPAGMEAELDAALRRMRAASRLEDRVGVASVAPDAAACLTGLLQARGHIPLRIHSALRLPFRLDVAQPETLGADRLAAAVAAWNEYGAPGERHVLVVDAGTAVTCEVVRRDGVYVGGTIGPGPGLALRFLRRGASQLPDADAVWPPALIGRSTDEAMQSGVLYGFVEGARGLLRRILKTLPGETCAVVTGGWRGPLAEHIPEIDRVDEHLVLKGVRQLMVLNEADAGE